MIDLRRLFNRVRRLEAPAGGSADRRSASLRGRRLAAASLVGALALSLLGLALGSATAAGKVQTVRPGKNAIQKAVDRARPGDVLRIRNGRYPEDVVVDKRLKLWGVDSKRPTIDGRCKTNLTLAVTHSGVTLKHLKVVGAAEGRGLNPSQVDFRFLGRGRANDLLLRETCGPEAAAEYGINLLGTTRVDVIDSVAKGGHTDAGIYLGRIQGTGSGSSVVKGNESFNNTVGVIVEQSRGDIRVIENRVYRNTVPGVNDSGGILVNVALGVLFADNEITDNGLYGVNLTPGSSNNVLNQNLITGNEFDVLDEGTGNCGSGNTIGPGTQIPPC